jgi:predicted nucleic acid-binding protein
MNLTIRAVEPDILVEAIQLAYQYAVTLYDAYFLALAVKADLVLVTADYKFYQKVGDVKSVIRLNELLGEDQETIRV